MRLLEGQDGWMDTVGHRDPHAPHIPEWMRCLLARARSGSRLRKLQAAKAVSNFKPGLNVERRAPTNIRPKLHFVARLMVLSRAEHIGPGDLIPGSGRGYQQQWSLRFTAIDLVQ